MDAKDRAERLKEAYGLEAHPEGGWFAEMYTSPDTSGGRPIAGSIYFLLDRNEISHFHQIDCDEIWYHHEGAGLIVTMLKDGALSQVILGPDVENGHQAAAVIPKGAVFAAETVDKTGYAFLSCVTAPQFTYAGFRLVKREEIKRMNSEAYDKIRHLAYPD